MKAVIFFLSQLVDSEFVKKQQQQQKQHVKLSCKIDWLVVFMVFLIITLCICTTVWAGKARSAQDMLYKGVTHVTVTPQGRFIVFRDDWFVSGVTQSSYDLHFLPEKVSLNNCPDPVNSYTSPVDYQSGVKCC